MSCPAGCPVGIPGYHGCVCKNSAGSPQPLVTERSDQNTLPPNRQEPACVAIRNRPNSSELCLWSLRSSSEPLRLGLSRALPDSPRFLSSDVGCCRGRLMHPTWFVNFSVAASEVFFLVQFCQRPSFISVETDWGWGSVVG